MQAGPNIAKNYGFLVMREGRGSSNGTCLQAEIWGLRFTDWMLTKTFHDMHMWVYSEPLRVSESNHLDTRPYQSCGAQLACAQFSRLG